jgi:hypothetical protein
MSERQKTAAFFQELILHSDSAELHQLQEQLARAEREQRCLVTAIRLMLVMAMLSLSGLGFAAVLVEGFDSHHLVVQLFSALVLSSFICLLSFAVYSFWHRRSILRVHADCRRHILTMVNTRITMGSLRDHWPNLAEIANRQTTSAPKEKQSETVASPPPADPALESFAVASVGTAQPVPSK